MEAEKRFLILGNELDMYVIKSRSKEEAIKVVNESLQLGRFNIIEMA